MCAVASQWRLTLRTSSMKMMACTTKNTATKKIHTWLSSNISSCVSGKSANWRIMSRTNEMKPRIISSLYTLDSILVHAVFWATSCALEARA